MWLNAEGNADDAGPDAKKQVLRGKTIIVYKRPKNTGSLGIAAKRCSNDAGGSKLKGVVARGKVLLGRPPKGEPRRTVA